MASILGTGISGLLAHQRALSTTSHNISNVNTDGYSRQRVQFDTQTPFYAGFGYVGTGTRLTDISRIFDQFKVDQLRSQTSNNERFDTFHGLTGQIDNLLADPNAGLSPMLDAFFASVQGVADNPSSVPSRQVMLTNAESLVDRFDYLDSSFRSLNQQVNQQLRIVVDEVNTLARGLADLNDEIVKARGAAGSPPNDLMDRRDLMLNRLSELVDVRTVELSDGNVNVFIGTGQGLVIGKDVLRLNVAPDPLVQDKLRIMIGQGPTSVDISQLLKGGKLGGTISFADQILSEARNELGRLAVTITEQFNQLHRLGIDLNGDLGLDFFRPMSPQINPSLNNDQANVRPVVTYQDVTKLTTKDYLFELSNGIWRVTDYRTGAEIPATRTQGDGNAQYLNFDGLRVELPVDGSNNVISSGNYSFLIRPTNNSAFLLDVALNDPSRIAAAGAIQAEENVTAQGLPSNVGTAKINSIQALNREYLPIADNVSLAYAAGEFTLSGMALFDHDGDPIGDISFNYDVTQDGGSTFRLYQVTDSTGGISYEILKSDADLDPNSQYQAVMEFVLSGAPANDDQFLILNNNSGVGDNRNALALAALQSRSTMLDTGSGPTASYQVAYGQMISRIGTQSYQAGLNKEATATLRHRAEEAVQSVSGVNLDEEAANLIRFQQAYQANAQVISVANSLFQTLLGAF